MPTPQEDTIAQLCQLEKMYTWHPEKGTVDPEKGTVDPEKGTVDPEKGTIGGSKPLILKGLYALKTG
jgi:hypothetical protein